MGDIYIDVRNEAIIQCVTTFLDAIFCVKRQGLAPCVNNGIRVEPQPQRGDE